MQSSASSALHPEVTISLCVNTSGTVNHWTSSQFCDLGVAVYTREASNCEIELLSKVAVGVLPAGHRLAKKAMLKPKDLHGERFVSLSHDDGTRAQKDEAFERALAIQAQSSAICCEMVRCGMGVTLARPIVAQDFVGPGIAIRPFTPAVMFPPHQPRARLTLEFVKVLQKTHDEQLAGIDKPERLKRA